MRPSLLVGALAGLAGAMVAIDAIHGATDRLLEGRRSSIAGPAISGVSPRVTTPGSTITITGSDLSPAGYRAEVVFKTKYREWTGALVERRVGATGTSTSLSFSAPSNVRPDSVVVLLSPESGATASSPNVRVPIPGRIGVIEPPAVFSVGVRPTTGVILLTDLIAPGRVRIAGRHLVPLMLEVTQLTGGSHSSTTGGTTRVTYGGTSLPIIAMGYGPGDNGDGIDTVIVNAPDLGTASTNTVTVTTEGGSASRPSVRFVGPPRVSAIREKVGFELREMASATLYRGRRYVVVGEFLSVPYGGSSSSSLAMPGSVRVGQTGLSGSANQAGSQLEFLVPLDLAEGGPLVVRTLLGEKAAGTYTVASAPIPALANMSADRSRLIGGQDVTLTITFAGAVTPGASNGDIVIEGSSALLQNVPRVVAINANPLVIQLGTKAQYAEMSANLKVRLAAQSGGVDELTGSLTLLPLFPNRIVLTPSTVSGGQSAIARVEFATAPTCAGVSNDEQLRVQIVVNDSSLVSVGGEPRCIASMTESFTLVAQPVVTPRTVTVRAVVTRKASGGGAANADSSVFAFLEIRPGQLRRLTMPPAVTATESSTGTLELTAPLAGAVANLSSSDGSVVVPATVTFGAAPTATFSVGTRPVATARSVTLTATVDGRAATTSVTVNPLAIQSLTFAPDTVRGGNAATATLTLNATPAVPLTFALHSDQALATPPRDVIVPAGSRTVTFAVATVAPTSGSPTVATIRAVYTYNPPLGSPASSPVTISRESTLTVTR